MQVIPVWYEFPKYRQNKYFKSLRFSLLSPARFPNFREEAKNRFPPVHWRRYILYFRYFCFWRAASQPFLFFIFGVILVGAAYHFSVQEGRWDWLVWASAFWTYINMHRDKVALKKKKLDGAVLRTWQHIEKTAAAHPRLAVFEKAFSPDGEAKGNTAVFLLPTLFLLVLSIVFWLYPHGWWTGEKMAVHFLPYVLLPALLLKWIEKKIQTTGNLKNYKKKHRCWNSRFKSAYSLMRQDRRYRIVGRWSRKKRMSP